MTSHQHLTVTEADHLSPMPTPHSRRGRRRGPKVVLVTLVLLLTPLLILELFVQGLIATGRLPTAPSNNQQLDIGLIQVRARPAQDVLLVGDSQMATALDPSVLQKLIRDEMDQPITVYNFGQPASTTEGNRLVLEQLVKEGKKPRVVVIDVAMSSLVNTRFQEPRGGNGEHALVDEEGRPTLLSSALGRQLVGCDIEDEIIDRLDCEIANVSAAWRWHGRPDRVIRAAILGAQYDRKAGRGILREDGFFARHPAPPERLQEQVGNLDFSQSRVRPAFNKGEADSFKDFLAWADERGIEVVMVGWPLTKPYTAEMLARNPDWLADREAATKELADYLDHPIVYVPTYGDWFDDTSASDLNHLSAEAAKPFTHQLWGMDDFRSQLVTALGGTVEPAPVPAVSPMPGESTAPAESDAPVVGSPMPSPSAG